MDKTTQVISLLIIAGVFLFLLWHLVGYAVDRFFGFLDEVEKLEERASQT